MCGSKLNASAVDRIRRGDAAADGRSPDREPEAPHGTRPGGQAPRPAPGAR